jgi:two-component system NtrC family sensor kinase
VAWKVTMTGERILVVDDSPAVSDVLCNHILPEYGFQTLSARSGPEAIALALEQEPDLIMLDQRLPGMEGLDVLRRLREEGLPVAVIMMTAHGSESVAVEAFRLGARDYVVKPIQSEVLIASIERALRETRLAKEKEDLLQQVEASKTQLEMMVARLVMLNNVGKAVTSMLDVEQVLDRVLDSALHLTRADESAILLADRPGKELYLRAARGSDSPLRGSFRIKVDDSIAGEVLRSGRPIIARAARGREGVKVKTGYLVKALALVPLRLGERVIGVLATMDREARREFGEGELHLLSALADYAAIAIENARLYEGLQRQTRGMVSTWETGPSEDSPTDLGAALHSVLGRLLAAVDAPFGLVAVTGSEENVLYYLDMYGSDIPEQPPMAGKTSLQACELFRSVLNQDELRILSDREARAALATTERQILQAVGGSTVMLVPLRSRGLPVGLAILRGNGLKKVTADRRDLCLALAGQAAALVENAQLLREARALNETLDSRVRERTQQLHELVATVSHELRSPLTAIRGYTDLVLRTLGARLSEFERESLTVVLAKSEQLEVLVEDLLTLSRIDEGRMALALEPVSLSNVVGEVVRALTPQLESGQLTVDVSVPPDVPPVAADPVRCAQVITNLVSNACRYTPAGGSIAIRAQHVASLVQLNVVDSGIGIDEGDRARIFERFFRARAAVEMHERGTGLGLAICRSLIKLHGGRIWFESHVGQGSTFSFTLPVWREEEA